MIDLVLQSASQATLLGVLASRGFLTQNEDLTYSKSLGFDYCWWADTGKLMTKAPVLNPDGTIKTTAIFLAGVVMLTRLTDPSDDISDPIDTEQWSRSRLAQYIKTNGVLGQIGGIPCYTLSGVRMARAADVLSFLSSNNLPGHEWSGGNSF